jgi:hypothetical protein
VVAGIALAVGLGNHRPSVIVSVATAATFACVFGSVTSAVLATVSLFHWDRQFPDQAGSAGTVYSFVEHGSGAETFEDFKQQRATESPEQILDEALRELWQISQLHRDRYRWLRRGQRWLFVALLCLLITVVLADAFKLTWIATTMYPRPRLILCLSDPLAAAPFLPGGRSWAALAFQDLGVTISVVDLPTGLRQGLLQAQRRQYR